MTSGVSVVSHDDIRFLKRQPDVTKSLRGVKASPDKGLSSFSAIIIYGNHVSDASWIDS